MKIWLKTYLVFLVFCVLGSASIVLISAYIIAPILLGFTIFEVPWVLGHTYLLLRYVKR